MVEPIQNWMTINGKRPENLRIIHFEHLQDDYDTLADEFGFSATVVPHINSSEHDHYLSYLTPKAEEAIYKKFQYLFMEGFYERQSLSFYSPTPEDHGTTGTGRHF